MSMDKSLRSKGELVRHRNVLSRAERVEALKEQERFGEDQGVFSLPKVAHRKVATRKKSAKEIPGAAGEGEAAPAAAEKTA